MAEVSEQEEAVQQPQQESKNVSEEWQTPPEQTPAARQDLKELDTIREELSSLLVLCNETLKVCADLDKQERVQRQLKTYASGLIGVATALQHLNDFRRLIPGTVERATTTRQDLIAARGGEEDALVSEEGRVLMSVEHTKDIVLQAIATLEQTLSQVRDSTSPLLATISYTSPGFEQFASQALSAVRIDLVASAVSSVREQLSALRQDVHDVYVLAEHAQSLSQ